MLFNENLQQRSYRFSDLREVSVAVFVDEEERALTFRSQSRNLCNVLLTFGVSDCVLLITFILIISENVRFSQVLQLNTAVGLLIGSMYKHFF